MTYQSGKPRPGFPKKFGRPSIDLDHHAKSWQDVPAGNVRVGDLIAERGLVHEAYTQRGTSHVVISAGEHGPSLHNVDDVMRVFR